MANRLLTGDGSGGTIGVAIDASGGFLYRVEMMQVVKGDSVASVTDFITAQRNLSDPAGAAALAQLNWVMLEEVGPTFRVHVPSASTLGMLRRTPLGRTDRVDGQILVTMTNDTNTNAITYEFTLICTYWRVQATSRPGWLQAFHEAPPVPEGR